MFLGNEVWAPFNLVDYCRWITARQHTVFKENIIYAITSLVHHMGYYMNKSLKLEVKKSHDTHQISYNQRTAPPPHQQSRLEENTEIREIITSEI